MGYYSFVVIAQRPVGIAHPLLILDSGVNAFTAQLDDLEVFLTLLKDEGVRVIEINHLDHHEPVSAAACLLLPEDAGNDLERLLSEEAKDSS